jgi:hypothetical protein
MKEHFVAIFESDEPAAKAARGLEDAGIPAVDVKHYANRVGAGRHEEAGDTRPTGAVSSNMTDLVGVECRPEQGAATGSTVLSVTVSDDSQIHQAVTILESHHPVEIEESTEEEEEEEEVDEVADSKLGRA